MVFPPFQNCHAESPKHWHLLIVICGLLSSMPQRSSSKRGLWGSPFLWEGWEPEAQSLEQSLQPGTSAKQFQRSGIQNPGATQNIPRCAWEVRAPAALDTRLQAQGGWEPHVLILTLRHEPPAHAGYLLSTPSVRPCIRICT